MICNRVKKILFFHKISLFLLANIFSAVESLTDDDSFPLQWHSQRENRKRLMLDYGEKTSGGIIRSAFVVSDFSSFRSAERNKKTNQYAFLPLSCFEGPTKHRWLPPHSTLIHLTTLMILYWATTIIIMNCAYSIRTSLEPFYDINFWRCLRRDWKVCESFVSPDCPSKWL